MTNKSIYSSIEETISNLLVNVNKYTPSRLYIKRIKRDSGEYIYYFGKSFRADIFQYTGSGKIWTDYIKKYQKFAIETIWVSDVYFDSIEIQKAALQFSLENDIISSEIWANSKLENGIDGGILSKESKLKISQQRKGIKHSPGTSGLIWINDGVRRQCIKTDAQLPEGWSYGYKIDADKIKGMQSVLNKKIFNNGSINKYFILGSEPPGWILGSIVQEKRKQSQFNAGKFLFNDGISEQYFNIEDAPDGWIRGELKTKQRKSKKGKVGLSGSKNGVYGKVAYHDGKRFKWFFKDQQPDGWILGKPKKVS